MHPLLQLSHGIDELNRRVAQVAAWLVLFSCLVSAGNAALRYSRSFLASLNLGPIDAALEFWGRNSNGFLEVQWQFFAGIFLLGAAYVLKVNEHVRVDLFYGSRSERAKLWIDVVGLLFFFFPAVLFILYLAWPFFLQSFNSGEHSSNAGGLLLWPVKLLLPLGFLLLALQGVSELVKRVAALRGAAEAEVELVAYEKPLQ